MNKDWDDYLELVFSGSEADCTDGEFQLPDGRRFATYSTMYGDGCYPCSDGSELGVDSGSIGCIRVEDI